jgi:leader peptidase (prepilin peptidase)/N-methyltransferase
MRLPVALELPAGIEIVVAALVGAIIGSFLNVCILRWGAEPKQSVVRPPSRCPRCGRSLSWYDNIPVLSWLLLRARCRGCGEPISVQYPLIELATAGIWAFMAWRYGLSLEALRGAVFGTILLGIAMTDAREYIIPDEFSLGGLVLALVFSLTDGLNGLASAALGAAVGFGVLWLAGTLGTWVFKQDAMGGGDMKMMAMVGAFLGWQGVLLTIFLGALLGSLVFVPLHLAGQRKLVPFGIFLSIAAAATYALGPTLFDWYGYLVGA